MKKTFAFAFMCLIAISSMAQAIDLSKYVWKKTATTFSRTNIQGGAYYKGKYYQFHDKTGGIKVFDVKTMTYEKSMPMTADGSLHFGSVSFSNEFSYIKNEEAVTTTLPLIYATGHYNSKEIVDVIDIEHNTLVRKYEFPNRKDDVIAAWDFEGKRFWIIGYEPATGYAETPYYINEYKWNEDGTYSEVGDVAIVDITMSTLQDCYYKDGHIYILAGWGKSEKNPSAGQYVSIHDYNTSTKRIETTLASKSKDEAEGFAYVPETNSFIVTTWTRGGSNAYYWHVALPGTEPYYTTLDKENLYDFDRYNVDGEKNYEVYNLTLNDMCDNVKLPADAKSMKAAKISYSREGVSGVNSVCMPFALKPEMVDGGIYTVSGTKENSVTLAKQANGVAAGVPCFVKSDTNWSISLDCLADNNGEMYDIAVAPVAPTGDVKLFGSYKTTNIGEGFYKVDESGKSLLHTSASSNTFPFRAYLQLPSSVKAAQITFADDEADGIKSVAADVANGAVYNLAGQRVNANAKGLMIINGRKVVR